MQIARLDKKQTTRLFYSLAGSVLLVFLLTSEQKDPFVQASGIFLGILCLYPLYLWLLKSTRGLPLWPIFCMVTGITMALPMVQNPASVARYSPEEIVTGGATVSGFIILGTVVWFFMLARPPRPPRRVFMVSREHAQAYLFVFVAAGLLFQLNQSVGFLQFPGNTMQIIRGVCVSLNTLGLFVLSFYYGQGVLQRSQVVLLILLGAATALVAITGLLLINLVVPVAMMLFGFMLGSGRVPWKGLAATIVVLAVLHPGKFAMRQMAAERGYRLSLSTLPSFYAEWIGYSFEEVGSIAGALRTTSQEGEKSTMFERSGNLHMLLLVEKMSPDQVPFMNGLTYQHIPRMLVPRFLDEEKGVSHAGNMILSVNYGLQTEEGTRGTSIGWGLIPEAYANFGYTGVAFLAVLLALFYSFAERISVNVPMTSLRFVVSLLFMAAATQADTMGVFVTTQFQGIAGVTLASVLLMRRQPNPFAEEQEVEVRGGKVGGWERRKQGAGSGERGAREQSAKFGRLEDLKVGEGRRDTASVGPRDVGTGGIVRTMPMQAPKRIARWMPRRVRAAVVAARGAPDPGTTGPQDDGQKKTEEEGKERPRQLAVPYQNYRRYRGA